MPHSNHHIRFIPQQEIDKEKWDALIAKSNNAFIYSTTTYLDLFTIGWGGIVYGDYQVVMAVPFKSKLGIKYTYTPVGVAQLGMVGHDITEQLEDAFLNALHQEFKYGMLHLGPFFSKKNAEKYGIKWKTNFILPLNEPYEVLQKNYTKDATKNLRKANELAQLVSFDVDTKEIGEAFMQQYGNRGNTRKLEAEYKVFANNLEELCAKGMAFKIAIRTETGELLGAGVFGKFRSRIYYVFGAPTALGRSHQTAHILMDSVIQKYAGTDYILDFEGSSIPSVAMFYKKFSPVDEPYPLYKFNHLPEPVKWLKK